MIELTEQQMQALENPDASPPEVVNPRTKETFVLLRVDEYRRLKENEYDDSPWTREEIQALAWEAGEHGDCGDGQATDEALRFVRQREDAERARVMEGIHKGIEDMKAG